MEGKSGEPNYGFKICYKPSLIKNSARCPATNHRLQLGNVMETYHDTLVNCRKVLLGSTYRGPPRGESSRELRMQQWM